MDHETFESTMSELMDRFKTMVDRRVIESGSWDDQTRMDIAEEVWQNFRSFESRVEKGE